MEHIIDKECEAQFRSDYTRYAMYLIYRRVIPDFRDGFSPVQRRIIWSMYEQNAISKTIKSASIVGHVIANYHPHGDSAVYGTMKPMTNWFEAYEPFITPRGNFGNFQGDAASAYRYTEARLSNFSMDVVMDDLTATKKCIDWVDTFDNSRKEPEFLPVKIPLLLIKGAFGIGLGKRIEIPTHNLNEVIDATIALIKDPNSNIALVPDHCMKCEIIDGDFEQISNTGFGYYTVRGKVEVGEYKGNTALVIKSVPNLVFLNDIANKIEELIEKKQLIQISNCHDLSTEKDMRYVIVLKPGANPEYVKDVLYKNTFLQMKQRVNFEVLNKLRPIRMSYKSYILNFIEHRKTTIFRIFTNKLEEVSTELHKIEAFIKLLKSGEVDIVISKIRKQNSSDDKSLIEYLIKTLNITSLQAKYILNTNIKNLSKGYLSKYIDRQKKLKQDYDQFNEYRLNESKIEELMINQLLEIKNKYGHKRNCKVIHVSNNNTIPRGMMNITVSSNNMIKKIPVGTGLGSFRGDSLKLLIKEDNTSDVFIFSSSGKVFKLAVNNIPFVDSKSAGVDIRYCINGITSDIISVIPKSAIENAKKHHEVLYIVSMSKNGLIKKMNSEDFTNIPRSGVIYSKISENDEIITTTICSNNTNFIAYSDREVMMIPTSTIPEFKRNAKGSRTFVNGEIVDGMIQFNPSDSEFLLVITKNGKVNKLAMNSLPELFTPRKIISITKISKSDRILFIIPCNNSDNLHITRLDRTVKEFPVKDIEIGSTISSGTRLVATGRGNDIVKLNLN